MSKKKILIAGAWPYANGYLHIGHLASLVPADVIARYYRQKGDSVYFVSGSDCFGTPVAIRAKQENKSPREISDFYHAEFCDCFEKLGFTYDRYGKTSSDEHINFVRKFHKKMYESPYIYEKEAPQAFCEKCETALADRYVAGICPHCGGRAKGDQCDTCSNVLEPENLINPQCEVCHSPISFKKSKHLFIAISKLENELTGFVNSRPLWRKNTAAFSKRYIDEGLRDRAVTRDLDWGIDVPKEGYEDKKIYIWAENVLGYLSMSYALCTERGESYEDLWGENSRHYYVHGKDNIPFHTIILPSLMIANAGKWKLPDDIISSEHLTLEGRKISKSQNWAIWVKDLLAKHNPDSIRYFMITSGPEKRDTDFTWREFVNSHNGELLGAYGNFVNRTLAFISKYFNKTVPEGVTNAEISERINSLYADTGSLIEKGDTKEALDNIFTFIRFANKYFDTQKPWETRNTDIKSCKNTIFNCVQIIVNLAVLLEPFIPFSSAKIRGWLGAENSWRKKEIPAGFVIPEPEILFERLDKGTAEEEVKRLRGSKV
ncbi:MAG: methionine--tRNA ligase [Clostridiales bacterium]|jgi:methionyl-tRNA synthetase|nr:methionine--tRNA ligase [Clostridiales bacterium]